MLRRPGEQVRLEHRHEPSAREGLPGRGERGDQLGGVVGVVIHEPDAPHFPQPLEPPAQPAIPRQRLERRLQRSPERERRRRAPPVALRRLWSPGHLEPEQRPRPPIRQGQRGPAAIAALLDVAQISDRPRRFRKVQTFRQPSRRRTQAPRHGVEPRDHRRRAGPYSARPAKVANASSSASRLP